MDFSDPEENLDQESYPTFQPYVGDCLFKLKTDSPEDIYLWRVVITNKNIKKVWPKTHDNSDCRHEDLYWAIDFNKKLITLCNQCDSFAYGHKVKEND